MEICGFIGLQEIIVILAPLLIVIILPLIAIIDILRNEFNENNKLIWVLVVLLLPVLGAILYFIIGGKHKIK